MHLIRTALPVRDHAIVQPHDHSAPGSSMQPGEAGVNETRDGTGEHRPAESESVPRVLGVGLADGGGVSGEAVHVPGGATSAPG